jgi:hypothetical protein
VFRNVVKKMLPDAGGTRYLKSWTSGETATVSVGWTIQNVDSTDNLRVAVFVQDENSREIYQVETTDQPTPIIPVGIDPVLGDEQPLRFIVYPNPAAERFSVMFDRELTGRTGCELYNYQGSMVRELQIEAGEVQLTVDTDGLNKGVYLIRLIRQGQVVGNSRVVIMK